MSINLKIDNNTFGVISEFDNYDLEIVQRNSFVVPNNEFKLDASNIPVDGGTSNSNPRPVTLSRYFDDQDLIDFPINPVEDSESNIETIVNGEVVTIPTTNHHYNNTFVYNNLQRLCYEVLDPVVNITGVRPFIQQGLLFISNTKDLDMNSFVSDLTKGNAVIFNFEDDPDQEQFNSALQYILDYSLFDRVIVDKTLNTYNVPTIKVSVNENKRRMIFRVKK